MSDERIPAELVAANDCEAIAEFLDRLGAGPDICEWARRKNEPERRLLLFVCARILKHERGWTRRINIAAVLAPLFKMQPDQAYNAAYHSPRSELDNEWKSLREPQKREREDTARELLDRAAIQSEQGTVK